MSEREEQAPGASPVAMVERVAEALWQARHARMFPAHKRGEKYTSWAEMVSVSPESPLVEAYRFFARAAIAAMREPTEAMAEAGKMKCHGIELMDGSMRKVCGGYLGYGATEQWHAMIDRALKP